MKVEVKKTIQVAAVILGLAGCAPQNSAPQFSTADTTISPDAGIIGGQTVAETDPIDKTVAAIYDSEQGALCTGSILSEGVIVTAAHCVQSPASSIVVIFTSDLGLKAISPANTRRATAVLANPRYGMTNGKDQGDIGLVTFTGGLPAGYKAAKLLPDTTPLTNGENVVLAGYGINDGQADDGSNGGAGVLRKVSVQIKLALYGKTEVLMDQTHGKGACHGDSGGPAYVQQAGELLLFGITSRGVSDPNNDCSGYAAYTNILPYKTWITESVPKMGAARTRRVARTSVVNE